MKFQRRVWGLRPRWTEQELAFIAPAHVALRAYLPRRRPGCSQTLGLISRYLPKNIVRAIFPVPCLPYCVLAKAVLECQGDYHDWTITSRSGIFSEPLVRRLCCAGVWCERCLAHTCHRAATEDCDRRIGRGSRYRSDCCACARRR